MIYPLVLMQGKFCFPIVLLKMIHIRVTIKFKSVYYYTIRYMYICIASVKLISESVVHAYKTGKRDCATPIYEG